MTRCSSHAHFPLPEAVPQSIERDTKTFCFLVPDRDDPDGKEELVLIFGADKKRRYRALDLMEDAMSGRYRAGYSP